MAYLLQSAELKLNPMACEKLLSLYNQGSASR
jgi:hypothetical protein